MTRQMLGWLLLCALTATPVIAQTPLAFSDGKWDLRGDRTAIETVDGRDTLRLESGFAYRRDVRLEDGTIEFDVQVTTRRSFVYLMFRMSDDGEYEEIYLRPHKSGLPDAIQYAPVHQRQSAWQLYHGPGGTAPVGLEPGAWTQVRLVLQGSKAAVFVGDMAKPALAIPRLARPPQAGYIALRGFLPAGVPGAGPIARYANVTVRPGFVPFDFSSLTAPNRSEPGAVRAWRVSSAFVPPKTDLLALPEPPADGRSLVIGAEPDGLVLLHRFVKMPEKAQEAACSARIRVRAEQAGLRRFDLGFSDTATVFLNGRPLYHGDEHYSFDAPRQEGVIGYHQASLYLPLQAGDNDLVIVVSDSFGGWGLMGRFPDMRGLTVDAR